MLNVQFMNKENVLIVRLEGELDHHEAVQLRQRWQEKYEQSKAKHVILNLQNVTFMDSSGIGVILGRYKEIVATGGELIICAVHPHIHRLLEMSGILKIIREEKDEQFALNTLGVAS